MAYVTVRVELQSGENFPKLGDEVFLARDVDVRDGQQLYVGQLKPFVDSEGRTKLYGFVDVEDDIERYAMGRAEIVPLKKVKYSESRIDKFAKLMRAQIEGPVYLAVEKSLKDEVLA